MVFESGQTKGAEAVAAVGAQAHAEFELVDLYPTSTAQVTDKKPAAKTDDVIIVDRASDSREQIQTHVTEALSTLQKDPKLVREAARELAKAYRVNGQMAETVAAFAMPPHSAANRPIRKALSAAMNEARYIVELSGKDKDLQLGENKLSQIDRNFFDVLGMSNDDQYMRLCETKMAENFAVDKKVAQERGLEWFHSSRSRQDQDRFSRWMDNGKHISTIAGGKAENLKQAQESFRTLEQYVINAYHAAKTDDSDGRWKTVGHLIEARKVNAEVAELLVLEQMPADYRTRQQNPLHYANSLAALINGVTDSDGSAEAKPGRNLRAFNSAMMASLKEVEGTIRQSIVILNSGRPESEKEAAALVEKSLKVGGYMAKEILFSARHYVNPDKQELYLDLRRRKLP